MLMVTHFNVTHPPPGQKKFGRLDVTLWKVDESYYLNSTAEIFEDLGRQKQEVTVLTPISKTDRNFEHIYYHSTFDICKRAKGLISNSFMEVFWDGFTKGADHVLGEIWH
jgi:hypothetical protein